MSLTQSINELQTLLDQTKSEIASLESGKKASAPRCRKSLQSIKLSSHSLRKAITEHTKGLPVKSRTKKEEKMVEEPEPVAEPEPVKPKRARKKKTEEKKE